MIISKFTFIIGLLIIILISIFLPGIIFPSDVINNLPSYSQDNWVKPRNSLLADPVFQFEPWRMYAKESFILGQFPFWNDQNGNGSPFFANPQTAVLYPLNILYYLLPLKISLNLITLLKLYLFAVFTYLFIKELKSSRLSAYLGSLVAVFSGFPIVWVLWPHTNVYLLFPLILLLSEKIKNNKNTSYRFFIALTFTYFVGVLGGHPETLFMIAVIHLIYVFLRFQKDLRYFSLFLLSIIGGLLLGAIQLLPFIEYLAHSYAFNTRGLSDTSFLPKISFIQNIIPFILGAPHTEFYKPILNFTNFQETIGGYTGTAVLIFSVFGLIKTKLYKKGYVWLFIAVISLILAYGFIPVQVINLIPVLNKNANQRFVAFFAFAIAIIFSLLIDKIIKGEIKALKINKKIFYYLIPFSFISLSAVPLLGKRILADYPEKTQKFLGFLETHIFIILVSTLLFFFLIIKAIGSKHKTIYLSLLIIPILIQSFLLLWNYDPITKVDEYYPKIELVRQLQSLQRGNILEAGNMALTPDLNLAYGLSSIENNDAIQIASYKNAFDNAFPIKNQWKNVDYASLKSLQDFGVKYVISDHNINLKRDKIQSNYDKIIPITGKNRISIPFTAGNTTLSEIRFLTANYNRVNTCTLKVSIFDNTNKLIRDNNISCNDIRDYMFFTVSSPVVKLIKGDKYEVIVESGNTTKNNYIGLWGNDNNIPYIEILYDLGDKTYKPLWSKKSVYLWEVPNSSEIVYNGKCSDLQYSPTTLKLDCYSSGNQVFEIKKVNYPGWTVTVDGKDQNIIDNKPFISFIMPQGRHVVSIVYKPLTFIIGSLISLSTLLIILIFWLRNEKKELWWMDFRKSWIIWLKKVNKTVLWWHHVVLFAFSFTISLAAFIIIFKLINLHFSMPYTTGINWLTVNHYPKQQDYFYFFVGIIFITLFTFLLWFITLLLKTKKS